VKDITLQAHEVMQDILFIGLQNYCRFGRWSREENKQLKKNWKKATKVAEFY